MIQTRWRGRALNSICSVHEAIQSEASTIVSHPNTLEEAKKELQYLEDSLNEIWKLADVALLMGQAMENGLREKQGAIESLECELEDAETYIRDLEEKESR